MKKLLIVLLACMALAFAASYSATVDLEDDRGTSSAVHFGTRLFFESDPSCTVAGIVLSGDPCGGSARVCVGTNITINPNTRGRWAVGGNLNVISPYPYCAFGGYCPTMVDYSSKTESNVEWLDDALYDNYAVGGGGAEYAGTSTYFDDGIPRYTELGGSPAFDTQSVNYLRTISEPLYTNKRGYANVFCKGTYEVKVGGMTVSRRDMADGPRSVTVPLRTEGTANLRVSLKDIDCFSALVKHPVDLDHPEWFGLYMYGYNTPSVPDLNEDSRIEVVDIQPELTIRSVDVESYVGSTYLLRINVENTGDVRVRATRVIPICTSGCSAHAAGGTDCIHYGFCVSDNGFGTYIAPGARRDLYVTYYGAFSGDILRIIYESPDEVCSDEDEWELIVNIPDDGITRCEIEPSSNIVTPYEVHEYTVTCYNSLGSTVPCSGNNWYWDSIPGGFVERTSSYAYAYTADTLSDVSGRIAYETDGVICTANVFSDANGGDDPYVFVCDLKPDSVTMEVNDSQYFDLRCSESYRSVTNFVFPTSVDYAMIRGLVGALSSESVRGVNYTATVDNVTGDVEAMAWHTHPDDGSLVGYIDWSHVIVGTGGPGNETNETGDDDDDEDEYEDCLIDPGDITSYPGWDGDVTIRCGSPPDFSSSCSDVTWSIDIGSITDYDDYGAEYVIDSDAELGDTGQIWARVNTGDVDEGLCHADISILEPNCIEIS